MAKKYKVISWNGAFVVTEDGFPVAEYHNEMLAKRYAARLNQSRNNPAYVLDEVEENATV